MPAVYTDLSPMSTHSSASRPAFGYPVAMLLLLACATPAADSPSDSDTALIDTRPAPAALATPSADCPVFDDDKITLTSNGVERKVHVLLPDPVPADAPVVFAWYPLGATASQLINYLDLDTWAADNGVIVVVPEAKSDNLFEWDFWDGLDDDFVLYDDLRTCLSDAFGTDLRRVYSTGMSAGGLMTTKLSLVRSDTLATVLVMSGGTPDAVVDYETPTYDFPALLTYGGATDHWGGGGFDVDFEAATLAYADSLSTDGHFVVTCNHNGGHNFPPDPVGLATTWLLPHVYGEASPFEGDISSLPDICAIWPELIPDTGGDTGE